MVSESATIQEMSHFGLHNGVTGGLCRAGGLKASPKHQMEDGFRM